MVLLACVNYLAKMLRATPWQQLAKGGGWVENEHGTERATFRVQRRRIYDRDRHTGVPCSEPKMSDPVHDALPPA